MALAVDYPDRFSYLSKTVTARRAFEKQIMAQRNAVVGAMKIMYWLLKENVAHTTKYES